MLPLDEANDLKAFAEEQEINYVRRPTFAFTEDGCHAHYIKIVFTPEEMTCLAITLQASEEWEWRHDTGRGSKPFYITGDWTAQGHCRPRIDKTYPAGQAGKTEHRTGIGLTEFLQPYAQTASALLRKHRPDVLPFLEDLEKNKFGDFHLFMSPQGTAKCTKTVMI